VIQVLVADDSALMRKLLGEIFRKEADFEVRFAKNGVEALEQIRAEKPDVVTLDVHMPQMDGLACLERIMVEQPCAVVMVSSLTAADADVTFEAMRIGAVDFIAKPSGALSLSIEEIAVRLVEKVRGAADAKLRTSARLKDRVRHKLRSQSKASTSPEAARKPSKSTIEAASGDGLVIVGTSTGGPPALEALLAPLPQNFPWPIVIAQHMPASFTGALAKRLDRLCAISVVEVDRLTTLKPGHAYLARGDADVIVSTRPTGLVAMPAPAEASHLWHPSTTRLVETAMKHIASSQIVGILMTGMGSDGAQAMAQLHAEGGRTIAEAEETAVVWGMPGELVKAGAADFIAPLPELSSILQKLVP
jgi:two-component system chemotaxis response regulator CheB